MAASSIYSGFSAGASLFGGYFQKEAADAQAQSLRNQARLMKAESEAEVVAYAAGASDFKAKQKLAYLKSGVSLEGSPLDILDETTRITSEKISAMRARTAAEVRLTESKAENVRGAGRAAFIGGALKAAEIGAKINYREGKTVDTGTATGFSSGGTGFGGSGFDEGSYK